MAIAKVKPTRVEIGPPIGGIVEVVIFYAGGSVHRTRVLPVPRARKLFDAAVKRMNG